MNLCWAEWNSDCSLDGATRGMALDSVLYVRWITTTSVANHRLRRFSSFCCWAAR
jgi:hypothetical protein